MGEAINVELLLHRALAPVDPPERLATQLAATLQSITDMAAEELEGWELAAMRDPRNWVRPAAALVVGSAAGAALVLLRARQRHRDRPPASIGELRDRAAETAQDFADEARRLLDPR
ncbi:MAG TPA: YtxH domain-containing protein [Solirubrobacteraceae bacterium]|jgi:hypothetical protein|nr:YtxH domain-containing protein [Solirubrobacteraceae bacterium]